MSDHISIQITSCPHLLGLVHLLWQRSQEATVSRGALMVFFNDVAEMFERADSIELWNLLTIDFLKDSFAMMTRGDLRLNFLKTIWKHWSSLHMIMFSWSNISQCSQILIALTLEGNLWGSVWSLEDGSIECALTGKKKCLSCCSFVKQHENTHIQKKSLRQTAES